MGWGSGQSYSQDLRARVLTAVDRGGRVSDIAALFEHRVAYVIKSLARRRLHGIETALPKTGRAGRKLGAPRLHRRDPGHDEHDSPLRPRQTRQASGRVRAARSLKALL